MRVALVRWRNEQLCYGMDRWLAYATERERFQMLGRKVMGRYVHALQAKVLLAWHWWAESEAEHRAQLKAQAMEFLSGRHEMMTARVLAQWWELCVALLPSLLTASPAGRLPPHRLDAPLPCPPLLIVAVWRSSVAAESDRSGRSSRVCATACSLPRGAHGSICT